MIEDRPLSEFELDCVIASQMMLKQDEAYKKILSLKEEALMKAITNVTKDSFEAIKALESLSYEIGFWNGEAFGLAKFEKLQGRNLK
jgi:hypothetical protein